MASSTDDSLISIICVIIFVFLSTVCLMDVSVFSVLSVTPANLLSMTAVMTWMMVLASNEAGLELALALSPCSVEWVSSPPSVFFPFNFGMLTVCSQSYYLGSYQTRLNLWWPHYSVMKKTYFWCLPLDSGVVTTVTVTRDLTTKAASHWSDTGEGQHGPLRLHVTCFPWDSE